MRITNWLGSIKASSMNFDWSLSGMEEKILRRVKNFGHHRASIQMQQRVSSQDLVCKMLNPTRSSLRTPLLFLVFFLAISSSSLSNKSSFTFRKSTKIFDFTLILLWDVGDLGDRKLVDLIFSELPTPGYEIDFPTMTSCWIFVLYSR